MAAAWRGATLGTLALALTAGAAACTTAAPAPGPPGEDPAPAVVEDAGPDGVVTIALAGDVHVEAQVRRLLRDPEGLGPIARTLRAADVTVLNLETTVTSHRRRETKEREVADTRYHFRTRPRALEMLAEAGVDVVSLGNNHAGDYGRRGLLDTLAAARAAGVATIGAGEDREAAFAPHRVEVGGLEVAVLGADTVFREGGAEVWEAGEDAAGIAAARGRRTETLVAAVADAAATDDVVVVYLHWGIENEACPTQRQRLLVRDLAGAGADVVVGSHSHVLGGAGWAGKTYVGYGLGNFVWYHDRQPDTGVLTLRLGPDGVVGEDWTPARIHPGGRPRPLGGANAEAAIRDWRSMTRCAGLAAAAGERQTDDPAYTSRIRRIDAELARRMRTSHRPGCPVPLRDLRYVEVTHRDFSGRARTGEIVVHERLAEKVAGVFGRLYEIGWPIARMRLVDDYGGDDDASMAANNTSGFNCRRVAGQTNWSAHAYGAAIDLNPQQNPYVRPGSIDPPNGRRFAGLDRAGNVPVPLGVIRRGSPPVDEFAGIGWQWGGNWISSKDYQHVAVSDAALASLG